MDIGLFSFAASAADLTAAARTAHQQGFTNIWTPQVFAVDALTAIAVAGAEVPEIRFGTAVVPTYPRHPQMLAQQALTVNEVVDGRLTLGIGPSHKPVVEGMWGMSFDRPVRHVREYLEALIPLMNDKSVRASGELVTARTDIQSAAEAPPVLVAALGPQMLGVAGRLADGTILWMTGPKTIATHTVPTINAAAEAAGRPQPQVVAGLPVCVTDGSEAANAAATAAAAQEFAIYGNLPSYRAMLDREGMAGPENLAMIGSADEVAAQISALADTGLTTFTAAAFGNPDQMAATREMLVGLL